MAWFVTVGGRFDFCKPITKKCPFWRVNRLWQAGGRQKWPYKKGKGGHFANLHVFCVLMLEDFIEKAKNSFNFR